MILKRQKLGAFPLTKDIGADGVEVDMGGLGERETWDNQLTNAATRQQFRDKAKELGLEIPSLAMTGFFAQSVAERPTVPRMIQDCVGTMKAMNVKVAFLPLGVKGDLAKNPELRPAIVKRLKMAGEIAARASVVEVNRRNDPEMRWSPPRNTRNAAGAAEGSGARLANRITPSDSRGSGVPPPPGTNANRPTALPWSRPGTRRPSAVSVVASTSSACAGNRASR